MLQSELDRAENRCFFEPETSVARLAAALGWGLIQNHVFLDGNKRIGLEAVLTFPRANNFELACPESKTHTMTLRVAASEITEKQWTAWLETVVRPSE